jgi:hypothetical protein
MYVIQIGAMPDDLEELIVGAPAYREPGIVWCQIARVQVRNGPDWAKVPPAA